MAAENAGIIVSVGSAIGTLIAVLTFWTKLTDRIAKAKDVAETARGIAENALQEAVEVNQEFRNMRGAFEEMNRDLRDEIERSRRETGERNAAIRQHDYPVGRTMTYSPTAQQLSVLRFIVGFTEAHGYSPSYLEMARSLGTWKSASFKKIELLEERGLIRRLPEPPRLSKAGFRKLVLKAQFLQTRFDVCLETLLHLLEMVES